MILLLPSVVFFIFVFNCFPPLSVGTPIASFSGRFAEELQRGLALGNRSFFSQVKTVGWFNLSGLALFPSLVVFLGKHCMADVIGVITSKFHLQRGWLPRKENLHCIFIRRNGHASCSYGAGHAVRQHERRGWASLIRLSDSIRCPR